MGNERQSKQGMMGLLHQKGSERNVSTEKKITNSEQTPKGRRAQQSPRVGTVLVVNMEPGGAWRSRKESPKHPWRRETLRKSFSPYRLSLLIRLSNGSAFLMYLSSWASPLSEYDFKPQAGPSDSKLPHRAAQVMALFPKQVQNHRHGRRATVPTGSPKQLLREREMRDNTETFHVILFLRWLGRIRCAALHVARMF